MQVTLRKATQRTASRGWRGEQRFQEVTQRWEDFGTGAHPKGEGLQEHTRFSVDTPEKLCPKDDALRI